MTKRDATYANIEDCGLANIGWLSKFFDASHEIPIDDTFRRILERANSRQLEKFLRRLLKYCVGGRDVISVDGKTIRGSGSTKGKTRRIVSALIKLA